MLVGSIRNLARHFPASFGLEFDGLFVLFWRGNYSRGIITRVPRSHTHGEVSKRLPRSSDLQPVAIVDMSEISGISQRYLPSISSYGIVQVN